MGECYIYQADVWCVECGESICQRIEREGEAPFDTEDQTSYDSDEYPKREYNSESDTPEHCASDGDCVNTHTLPSGRKIGVPLENDLTSDGVKYVKVAVEKGGEVADLWKEIYDYIEWET